MKKIFTKIENASTYYDIERRIKRGNLVEVHMADIHFGAIDAKTQFNIIKEQVLDVIANLPILDIIFINGDLFDRKFTADTPAIMYANMFFSAIREIAINKNATVVLLYGTAGHDADQLKMFYHYLKDPLFDLRIVETIKFEYIKGAKILCIPELYNLDERLYNEYLFYSGHYDQCVLHGTIDGAGIPSNGARLFTINDFCNCKGPIIAGHIHICGCYNKYFYYTGSILRWKYGEEQEKGFMVVLYDLDSRQHYAHMIPVYSFRYDTINIDDILLNDPKEVIDYINNLKTVQCIDHLRIEFTDNIAAENMEIIRNYYRNNNTIKLHMKKQKPKNEIEVSEVANQYHYILDDNLSEFEIMARYINERENAAVITADEIIALMKED